MKMRRLPIAGDALVLELTPSKYQDERGYFSEVFSKARLQEIGLDLDFVQDNQSLSRSVGTVRGLHFQSDPFAQTKLVRVLRGAIYDVAVDIRVGSSTYGKHVSVVVSAKSWSQILVPKGFAHGFCTIEPDTEVLYKVDAPYAPDHEQGIAWDDPDLGINWPVAQAAAIISDKDRTLPRLRELPPSFHFDTAQR